VAAASHRRTRGALRTATYRLQVPCPYRPYIPTPLPLGGWRKTPRLPVVSRGILPHKSPPPLRDHLPSASTGAPDWRRNTLLFAVVLIDLLPYIPPCPCRDHSPPTSTGAPDWRRNTLLFAVVLIDLLPYIPPCPCRDHSPPTSTGAPDWRRNTLL